MSVEPLFYDAAAHCALLSVAPAIVAHAGSSKKKGPLVRALTPDFPLACVLLVVSLHAVFDRREILVLSISARSRC
jgi:hypothetical protein